MRVVTTQEMRRLEQAAVDAGATWAGLMEHAGWGVAQEALRVLGDPRGRRVLVLVGPGNNGGDGLVVARHLADAQAVVTLYFWGRANPEQDLNWQRCRQRGLAEVFAAADAEQQTLCDLLSAADLVIDALLGMGVSRPVTGDLAAIVTMVNTVVAQRAALHVAVPVAPRPASLVLAIDLPTGINAETGAVMGVALRADTTVATGMPKRGMSFYPGRQYVGVPALADIGIPPDNLEVTMSEMIDAAMVRTLLPARPAEAHKGTFGKVLVVAGSLYYPGAAGLASSGAGRVGAGLVTLATGRSVAEGTGRGLETTLLPLPEADLGTIGPDAATEILKRLDGYQALLVGPGLGQEEATGLFLRRLLGLEQPKSRSRVGFLAQNDDVKAAPDAQATALPPTVLDADGLNLLAKIDDWPEHLAKNRFVLTPHPGEMKRLLKVDELNADLVLVAGEAAERWGQVLVLKGATTVVAAPDGRSAVYAGGNPALATAGTGDVLAGAIAGLLAQGLSLYHAAVLGVYLHGAAGALLREDLGEAGTLASDLLIRLPRAIKALKAED